MLASIRPREGRIVAMSNGMRPCCPSASWLMGTAGAPAPHLIGRVVHDDSGRRATAATAHQGNGPDQGPEFAPAAGSVSEGGPSLTSRPRGGRPRDDSVARPARHARVTESIPAGHRSMPLASRNDATAFDRPGERRPRRPPIRGAAVPISTMPRRHRPCRNVSRRPRGRQPR